MTDVKQNNKHKKSVKSRFIGLSTRNRTVLMIVINVALMVTLLTCMGLYFTGNNQVSYQQNIDNITEVVNTKAKYTQAIIGNSGLAIKTIYNYCDGMEVSDAMDYLSALVGDNGDEYQLLTKDINETLNSVYTGYSTRRNADNSFKALDIDSTNLAYALDKYGTTKKTVAYTPKFNNSAANAAAQYAAFCGLTLKDGGVDKNYFVLIPQDIDTILEKLKTDSQYPNLMTAVCDSDGTYLSYDDGFKSRNIYEFLYKYNNLTVDQKYEIMDKVNSTEGVGLLEYKDSKDRLCTFAYSAFSSESDWFVVVAVPNSDFVADEILGTYPIIIIVILAALLIFNMLQLLAIIKRLKVSIVNEKYANQAKTDFLSRMSHDMRTPLNSIINFSDFIVSAEDLPTAINFGEKINKSGRYLLTLINDSLSMSRIEAGHLFINPEPLNFREFEEGLMSILGDTAKKKGLDFSIVAIEEQSTTVMLDPLRLQQVFVNLLNNAIKFTPEGGTVNLTVSTLSSDENTLTLKFEVTDTGRGMSQDFIERKLFKPFAQENTGQDTEESGTGLGLSIAKNIVEQMKGTITCESELGMGTKFTVIVPAPIVKNAEQIAAEGVDDEVSDKLACLADSHILVCEDNDLNREIVAHLLDAVGCITETAENGRIGVEMFEKSEEYYFDAVLMDKRMPEMDGIEATKLIRALDRQDAKDVPIIALSADVFDEHVKRGIKSGMTSYLSKPIEPKDLYKELSARVHERNEKKSKRGL